MAYNLCRTWCTATTINNVWIFIINIYSLLLKFWQSHRCLIITTIFKISRNPIEMFLCLINVTYTCGTLSWASSVFEPCSLYIILNVFCVEYMWKLSIPWKGYSCVDCHLKVDLNFVRASHSKKNCTFLE